MIKRNLSLMLLLLVIGSMVLSACGAMEGFGRTKVTWFIGFGLGAQPDHLKLEKELVDEFNRSQNKIWLVLDIAPANSDVTKLLKDEIASGNSPDIVGPIGWGRANAFYGQWLDLKPYLEKSNFDMSDFDPNLVKLFETDEGNVSMPYAVFPAMVFYNKGMFDKAGLAYPPATYGEKYKMPDGTQVEWSWDTLSQVAKLLTLDKNGKNTTENGFDRENIVQYGYYPTFQDLPKIGTFRGADRLYEQKDGKTVARVPSQWAEAWNWYFDGIWGEQRFIPTGYVVYDKTKSNGNPFSYGILAMIVTQLWYASCCLSLPADSWDIAAIPSYQGQVHGRVDVDAFRILKSSKNPDASFEVLKYLMGPTTKKMMDTYGGLPIRVESQDVFFQLQKEKFPWVKNWDVVQAGAAYPDLPSAEGYTPHADEAYPLVLQFGHNIATEQSTNVNAEIEKLVANLQTLFDKK